MIEQFKAKAQAVSAEVWEFDTKQQALEFVKDFVKKENVNNAPVVWALGKIFTKDEILSVMPSVVTDVNKDIASTAHIGITEMDYGIAETGTLVQNSTDVAQRLASSLPLIHIAIIKENNILKDMQTVLDILNPKDIGYLAFITGPSRTADIERVLTIGVHGPERLIILVLKGEV
ncbi:MAG: lactate utilization protein [Thermodesulfovibrionales bacterium]|nr:lactate utilization protein [Thermodesulfovibrionales bacterium]